MAQGYKTGGRKKGTLNKVTKDLRVLIKDLLLKEFESIEEYMDKADPRTRMDFIIKLLPYALPRYESAAYDVAGNTREGYSLIQAYNDYFKNKLIEQENPKANVLAP